MCVAIRICCAASWPGRVSPYKSPTTAKICKARAVSNLALPGSHSQRVYGAQDGGSEKPIHQEGRPSQSLPGRAAECPMVCGNPPLHGGRRPESAGLGRGRTASQARGGISTLSALGPHDTRSHWSWVGMSGHGRRVAIAGHRRFDPTTSDGRAALGRVRAPHPRRPSTSTGRFRLHLPSLGAS